MARRAPADSLATFPAEGRASAAVLQNQHDGTVGATATADFTGDSEGWELPNALRGRTVNWVPLPTSYVPVSISSAGLPGTNDYFLPP